MPNPISVLRLHLHTSEDLNPVNRMRATNIDSVNSRDSSHKKEAEHNNNKKNNNNNKNMPLQTRHWHQNMRRN